MLWRFGNKKMFRPDEAPCFLGSSNELRSLETSPSGVEINELNELLGSKPIVWPSFTVQWPHSELQGQALAMLQNKTTDVALIRKLQMSTDPIEEELGFEIARMEAEYVMEQWGETRPYKDYPIWSQRPWLLFSQNPIFASPHPRLLKERMALIARLQGGLAKEFGDMFLGLILFGGPAKGHFAPESDIDATVVAQKEEVMKRFCRLALKRHLKLCGDFLYFYRVGAQGESLTPQLPKLGDWLMRGKNPAELTSLSDPTHTLFKTALFFGDHKRLARLQYDILRQLAPSAWEDMRRLIAQEEMQVDRASHRFNLPAWQVRKLKITALLFRTPPPYAKALRFLSEQMTLS